ncbi:MAG: tRNA lysidine(34) synthetase TilS [Paracoccaceae bacterium]
MSDSYAWLTHTLGSTLRSENNNLIAIAVSGGSDSLALLHLAVEHARRVGLGLIAVTVDHGLRTESADEARWVSEVCKNLGVDHTVLKWQGWDGSGNLQDRARRARYRLMAEWALGQGIDAIAVAHTADDQAETFLMRLARGAGVDGLSAMAPRREAHGIVWLRPLLQVERQQLRDYLTASGIAWLDDPSNQDPRYDRIKARQAMVALAPLGIDARSLSTVAGNLRAARIALELQAQTAAESIASVEDGDVVFDKTGLAAQPVEIGRRLLVHAIKWVSSAEYGPRGAALADAYCAFLHGKGSTLHGCRLLVTKSGFRVTRELQAVKNETSGPEVVWDCRWRVFGPDNNGLVVRALGESGLRSCPDWRETGRPRASLLATPSVWRGGELIAAPLAGMGKNWNVSLVHPPNHFHTSILSH